MLVKLATSVAVAVGLTVAMAGQAAAQPKESYTWEECKAWKGDSLKRQCIKYEGTERYWRLELLAH